MNLLSRCAEELKTLAAGNGDEPLKVKQVVAWAKANRRSAIYEWMSNKGAFDSTRAMALFQLIVVRRLMRRVTLVYADVPTPVQATGGPFRLMTALATDRANGGGYRTMTSVMESEPLRKVMLATALMELASLRQRHKKLTELTKVWQAIDEVGA